MILGRWGPAGRRVLANPRWRGALIALLFLVGSLTVFHALLAPVGGRFYDGDFVTPTTPAELRYYLAAFAGPWDPQSVTAGFNPFYTNDLILFSAVAGLAVVLGSVGTGMLAVFVLVEAALAASLYLAARRMRTGRPWALVGALAFAASPVVFDRTVAGHELILAAAVFVPPFLVLLSEASARHVSARHIAALGLLWGAVGLLEYHIFYLLGFVWGAAALAVLLRIALGSHPADRRLRLREGGRRLAGLLAAVAVAVGVNLVWLVPALGTGGGGSVLSESTLTTRWVLGYTQGAIQPATVFASNVYWGQMYTAAWGKVGSLSLGLVVSAALSVVFLAVLFWHAHRRTGTTDTLVLVALVVLLLSTGTVLPGSLYLTLVRDVPFFSVNDDPAKFDVVLAPTLALLLGNALQDWWRSARAVGPIPVGAPAYRWPRRAGRLLQHAFVPAVVAVIVVSALPFASGNFHHGVAHVPDAPGAVAAANTLDATVPPLGRVALFPPDPFEYVGHGQTPTNPLVVDPPGNALYLPGPPGLEPLNLATQQAAWAYTALYANSTSHGGSLFGLLGTTEWDVNLAAQPSTPGGVFAWDLPTNLTTALRYQVDLGPTTVDGQTELISTANATPGPVTLRSSAVLALSDRELLLDAAYLPGGDAWVEGTPFVLEPGSPSGTALGPGGSAPFVETPQGILDEVFEQLPAGSVVPVEPVAWAALGAGGIPNYNGWTPWEHRFGLESGRPLASLLGYAETDDPAVSLTVPLATAGGPRSEVWVDLFYGPDEGTLKLNLGGAFPVVLNAYAREPFGFRWTPVGALGNASHVVLNNGGNGASIVSELATVAPGAFPGAVNATVAWLPRNGAGPADPPVLWVKGDEGAGYGTWTTVATGSSDSQGWGSVVDPDGAYATTFLLPQATDLGVLARASGTGSIYVSACSAASLPDDSLEVCPVHTTVSFGNASPTWSASAGNLTVGPGIVKVTVYGASHSVLLDQLLLTPAPASLLAPCAAGVPTEWTCPGAATAGPSSVSGNPGGPSVTATFPPTSEFPVLAQLVSCDATWRASGTGVSAVPFLVDGWACGYSVSPGLRDVTLAVPGLVTATEAGAVGSALVAVPVLVLALFGLPKVRAFVRRPRVRA